jgi:hypothetical protein
MFTFTSLLGLIFANTNNMLEGLQIICAIPAFDKYEFEYFLLFVNCNNGSVLVYVYS